MLSVYFVWINHIPETLAKEITLKTIETKEQIVVALEIRGGERKFRKYCGITNIKEGIKQKDESDGSWNMKSQDQKYYWQNGRWKRKLDWLKGGEFSFVHVNLDIYIVMSYMNILYNLKFW